jgi:hypothetical protein
MRDEASRSFHFSRGIRRFGLITSQKSHDTFCFRLYCAINGGRDRMRKEKLKAYFKEDRSIPNRDNRRPENVSRKQNKQMAHHAPVRRAASKARGF